MPSKSESQKRLFCMAYAVRKGKLARNKVTKAVLDIADGDMTDKDIQEFMVKEESTLMDYIKEKLEEEEGYDTPYSSGERPVFSRKQEAFIIIKPGFLNLSEEILDMFKEGGFEIKKTKPKLLTETEAKTLYDMHKKEDFFDALVKYMSEGESIGVILHPTHAMTNENLFKAIDKIKDEVRDKWSESDMRNVMHSSDSLENMKNEAAIYF